MVGDEPASRGARRRTKPELGDAGREAYVEAAVATLVRQRRRSLGRVTVVGSVDADHATTAGITTTERVEVDVAVSRLR